MNPDRVVHDLAKLPRVPFDDTPMTVMVLNERPIIAVTTQDFAGEAGLEGRPEFCHIVRIGRRWSEA